MRATGASTRRRARPGRRLAGMSKSKQKWGELPAGKRAMVLTAVSVQLSLLLTAQADLRRRSDDEIRGSKRVWRAVAFVNFIGPLAYFVFGRKR